MTTVIEYEVDGTAVENAYRWLTPEVDGALGFPELRGDDLVYPGVEGEQPLPRVLGVAYEEFVLRVSGLNADGTTPADEVARFHTNLRATRQFFYNASSTISLLKRVHYSTGAVEYGPSDARCVGFTPRMEGPSTAAVLIRIKVYDGWGGDL